IGRFSLAGGAHRLIEIASKGRIVRGSEVDDGPLPLSPLAVCRPRLGFKINSEEYHAWHAGSRPVIPKDSRFRATEELHRKVSGLFRGRAGCGRTGRRRSDGAAGPQAAGRGYDGKSGGRHGAGDRVERERVRYAEAARDGRGKNYRPRDRRLLRRRK